MELLTEKGSSLCDFAQVSYSHRHSDIALFSCPISVSILLLQNAFEDHWISVYLSLQTKMMKSNPVFFFVFSRSTEILTPSCLLKTLKDLEKGAQLTCSFISPHKSKLCAPVLTQPKRSTSCCILLSHCNVMLLFK